MYADYILVTLDKKDTNLKLLHGSLHYGCFIIYITTSRVVLGYFLFSTIHIKMLQ